MFLLFIFDNISRLLSNQLKKYSTIILLTIYALYCPNKQNLQVVLFMALSKNFQNRFIELTDDLDEKSKSKRAKIIGISNTTYSNAYNYGIIPKTSSLIRIADYFNISIGFLIGNTDIEHFEKSVNQVKFKERLLDLQKEKGISTVYELSESVHIHRNNIAQWNKSDCIPLIDDLIIVADFFKVSIDYLLGRTDDKM